MLKKECNFNAIRGTAHYPNGWTCFVVCRRRGRSVRTDIVNNHQEIHTRSRAYLLLHALQDSSFLFIYLHSIPPDTNIKNNANTTHKT
eukprot:scaffold4253_cov105-Skeletonema_dohrnii-CCMP3373.AAC.2